MAVGAAKKPSAKSAPAKGDPQKTPEAKSKTSGVSSMKVPPVEKSKRLPVEEEVKQREEKANLAKGLLMTIAKPILEERGYVRAIGDAVKRPASVVISNGKSSGK